MQNQLSFSSIDKMGKNLILGPILACEADIWVPKLFLACLPPLKADIVPSYHLLQFKRKLMNQTSENGKKS